MSSPTESGISATIHEVVERVRALVRLEGELATIELRQKLASLGSGVALLVGAVVLALFAFGFLLATIASALANVLPMWAALLIVGIGLVASATVAALVGRSLLRKGSPPVPEQAIAEAKATGEALKGNGRG